MAENRRFIQVNGIRLHALAWEGEKRPFLLLHGLSSNAATWTAVAQRLHEAGHAVLALDQRGHGLSDKPADGYDFAAITHDLAQVVERMGGERPYIAGQSWGGNVVLEFGARYPGLAKGLIFVDGGTIDFQADPANTWEAISTRLKPPDLRGTPRAALRGYIQSNNPTWSEAGMEATLNNFETLPDGTVRPWLSLDRHMAILRAMWEQRPGDLYPQVQEPVLICMADNGDADWTAAKKKQVAAAEAGLSDVTIHWLPDTAHDIHVHRPDRLAALMLAAA